jgi:hypothetical protein
MAEIKDDDQLDTLLEEAYDDALQARRSAFDALSAKRWRDFIHSARVEARFQEYEAEIWQEEKDLFNDEDWPALRASVLQDYTKET